MTGIRFLFCLLFLLTTSKNSDARLQTKMWGYQQLLETSDLAAIIEPLSTKETKDKFPADSTTPEANNFIGLNTTFIVHAVLKGQSPPKNSIVILHFNYADEMTMNLRNGARFVHFEPGPYLRIGNSRDNIAFFANPTWLAFLKQRKDGRYEPVTGFYDAAYSFRELSVPGFARPDQFRPK